MTTVNSIDEVLAFIPARSGSKGIPRKNLIPLAGKPLLAWSIEQALATSQVTRTIVSTDDQKIAAVAREYGAEVPFLRPKKYADDLSPDIDTFRHAINWLDENEGYHPALIVHLRPTGPVRETWRIEEAIKLIHDHPEADALRSVAPALQTPFKMWRIDGIGFMQPVLSLDGLPDCQSRPRQQLPMIYWQNGYVDIIRPRCVLQHESMWGRKVLPYIIEEPVLELDYPEDIARVEQALQGLLRGKQGLGESCAFKWPV